jgi:2-polyprenyl-6-methoxyphenol hydroxylase-like FAD-dependent oxidoreductase
VSTTPQQNRVALSDAEGAHSDRRNLDVMVVGAGPTGLVLALWLKRLGIGVRIIDKAAAPGTTSRALVVHARTLELYRQLGLAAEVVERGLPFAAINMWVRGRHRARAVFGEIGRGLSPFPGMWIFPQDEHERLLIAHLRREGVEVERGTELVGFEERSGAIIARTRSADGVEAQCEAAYLAGCDGAHSRVREVLGIGFAGGTYARVFYVADVAFHGPVDNHELHVALDAADFVAVFPLKGDRVARLIGTVERETDGTRDLGWDDVSQNAIERMQIAVDRVNWFSTYRVHHRVAQHFRSGRAFLVGDAAHVHSPVGGQGMNTGIGDAANLAWKLAAAVRGQGAGLLDSYEPERIAFAERLVASTDRAFTFATRDGVLARLMRLYVFPALLASVMGWTWVRRLAFRTVSQILINYRHSRLNSGRAGSVRGGDRLPWVAPKDPSGDDNFTPLASLDWQIHVYGDASSALREAAARRKIPLHVFSWDRAVGRAGLARDAAYLVRPDGYVGLADPSGRAETLERYLDGLR